MALGAPFMEVDAALLKMMESVTIEDERTHESVRTSCGDFHVIIDGDRSKPAFVTFHEAGLNSETTFDAFLHHPSAERLKSGFCFYHINAPGQQADCAEIVEVPEMQVIIQSLKYVLRDLHIVRCVSLGYGAGAYIMAGLASAHPEIVLASILINAVTDGSSCRDYVAMNRACAELENHGLTENVEQTLFAYFCGDLDFSAHQALVTAFENKFKKQNPINLSRFLSVFAKRDTLSLHFKTPVFALFGSASPNANQTRYIMAGKPTVKAVEIPNCRLPLAETPSLVAAQITSFLETLDLL